MARDLYRSGGSEGAGHAMDALLRSARSGALVRRGTSQYRALHAAEQRRAVVQAVGAVVQAVVLRFSLKSHGGDRQTKKHMGFRIEK